MAADGGYGTKTFVEGVRALGLHTVGRLSKDKVLRFRYTGPHARRPDRKRQFDVCFNRRDLRRRVPSPPFPCAIPGTTTSRRKFTKELAQGQPRAETPPIPRPAAASPRNASGCSRPLSNRGRPAPEHGPRTKPEH